MLIHEKKETKKSHATVSLNSQHSKNETSVNSATDHDEKTRKHARNRENQQRVEKLSRIPIRFEE